MSLCMSYFTHVNTFVATSHVSVLESFDTYGRTCGNESFDTYACSCSDTSGCTCGNKSLIHMDAFVVIQMDELVVTSPLIHMHALVLTSPLIHMNAVVVIHLNALVVPSHLIHMHARVVTSLFSMHESSHTSEYVCGDESCLCARVFSGQCVYTPYIYTDLRRIHFL